jgi:hypothetical protein
MRAARQFETDLATIGDAMFGALAKGALGFAGSSSIIQLLSDPSLEKILAVAAATAAYTAKVGIDGILADRKGRRECSIMKGGGYRDPC